MLKDSIINNFVEPLTNFKMQKKAAKKTENQEVEKEFTFLRSVSKRENEDSVATKATMLEGPQEVNMSYSTEEITIGGKSVSIKLYTSAKSPKMAEVLTNESIVAEAQFLVDKTYSDAIMEKVKKTVMGGVGKKGIMDLVTTFMSMKPERVFGGRCDKRIDKGISVNCLFKAVKEDLPTLMTSLIGMDDDESDSSNDNSDRGGARPGSSDVQSLI